MRFYQKKSHIVAKNISRRRWKFNPNRITLSRVFDWFGGFRTSLTYARLARNRRTDRQTSSSVKASYPLGGLRNNKPWMHCCVTV